MILTACLLGVLQPVHAAGGREFESWTRTSASVRLPEHLELGISEELRVAPNGDPTVDSLLTQLTLGWEPGDWSELTAGYRFGVVDWDGSPEVEHRVHFDAKQGLKLGDMVRLQTRERYQVLLPGADRAARQTARLRFSVKLKTNVGPQPYVSVEPYLRIQDGEDGTYFKKVRTDVGIKHGLDWGSVRAFYRVEHPLEDRTDPRVHVVGLGVNKSFDARR